MSGMEIDWAVLLVALLALTGLLLPGVGIWLMTDTYSYHTKKIAACFIGSVLCGAFAIGLIGGMAA